jgi:hypothetical protein
MSSNPFNKSYSSPPPRTPILQSQFDFPFNTPGQSQQVESQTSTISGTPYFFQSSEVSNTSSPPIKRIRAFSLVADQLNILCKTVNDSIIDLFNNHEKQQYINKLWDNYNKYGIPEEGSADEANQYHFKQFIFSKLYNQLISTIKSHFQNNNNIDENTIRQQLVLCLFDNFVGRQTKITFKDCNGNEIPGINTKKNFYFIKEFRAYIVESTKNTQETSSTSQPTATATSAVELQEEFPIPPVPSITYSYIKYANSLSNDYQGKVNQVVDASYNGTQSVLEKITTSITNNNDDNISTGLLGYYSRQGQIYETAKFYLDAGDIIHDVNSGGDYMNGLNEVYQKIGGSQSDIIDLTTYVGKSANQQKIREMRNKQLQSLKTQITGVVLPLIETMNLTEEEGYIEFFKEIFDIFGDSNIQPFIYLESGRELNFANCIKYYNQLDSDSQEEFKSKCYKKIGQENINIFNNVFGSHVDKIVKTYPITAFDGFKHNMRNSYNSSYVVFERVFGYYNYHVFSVKDSLNIEHLVFVTDFSNDTIYATFGFQGNVTIDLLTKNIREVCGGGTSIESQRYPEGEGGTGSITNDVVTEIIGRFNNVNIDKTNKLSSNFKKQLTDFKSKIRNNLDLKNSKIFKSCSFNKENSTELNHLLFLGNKTIGDLIFSVYPMVDDIPEIRVITTVDSLVSNSVYYNFLKGGMKILQYTWRKTQDKGWVLSPGLLKTDIAATSQFILVQIMSALFVLDFFGNIDSDETSLFDVPNNLKYDTLKNTIEMLIFRNNTNVKCINRVRNLLNYIYKGFRNYIDFFIGKSNVYKNTMKELLIYENKGIQNKINEYLNNINEICDSLNKNTISEKDFFNKMYELPKLENLLTSNISPLYENNENVFAFHELYNKIIENRFDDKSGISITLDKDSLNKSNVIFIIESTKSITFSKNADNQPQAVQEGTTETSLPPQTSRTIDIQTYIETEYSKTDNIIFSTLVNTTGSKKYISKISVPYTVELLLNILENGSYINNFNDIFTSIMSKIEGFYIDKIDTLLEKYPDANYNRNIVHDIASSPSISTSTNEITNTPLKDKITKLLNVWLEEIKPNFKFNLSNDSQEFYFTGVDEPQEEPQAESSSSSKESSNITKRYKSTGNLSSSSSSEKSANLSRSYASSSSLLDIPASKKQRTSSVGGKSRKKVKHRLYKKTQKRNKKRNNHKTIKKMHRKLKHMKTRKHT